MTLKELARSMQINNNNITSINLIDSLTLQNFMTFNNQMQRCDDLLYKYCINHKNFGKQQINWFGIRDDEITISVVRKE